MAVKSKVPRSKLKKKKAPLKTASKKTTDTKPKQEKKKFRPPLSNLPRRDESEDDDDQGRDMLGMVEEDDLDFLKNAIANKSYRILSKVRYDDGSKIGKKRKAENLEEEYEDSMPDIDTSKRVKGLLPIKTKRGIIPQSTWTENEDEEEPEDEPTEAPEDDPSLSKTDLDVSRPVSTAQLLAARNEALRQRKIHIGTLSAGLLENPEEKVMNLKGLLTLMDEEAPEIYYTVKKLVVASLSEVFKDILPSYEIKEFKSDGVKLKKDTLKLKRYEESLLLYYKKYLQKLEKFSFLLVRKKGDTRRRTEEQIKLGKLAIQSMCDLLIAHPYFNFSQNIAQAIVPFLNNYYKDVRSMVKEAVKTIFKEDKKEEITLKILRIVNHYLKTHSNVHVEMIEVLLVLNLKDVDLDKKTEQDVKQKKLKAHKSRILQLSKKERKRKKKLQEVEKELLETKAEENKQAKQKNLTEITKLVFNIYFRILKTSTNSKVVGVCLEGVAKFAHCINLEFYMDLVNVLDKLLREDWLDYRDQLHCVQTVFAILSGQGEDLNIDPTRFYNRLYGDLLRLHVASRRPGHVADLIRTLHVGLLRRRKKITNRRALGFAKRVGTLSLQLGHDGALGCLGMIRRMVLLNRHVDTLLDFDSTVGEGEFRADIDDPEYSNASSTALHELVVLRRHYHPVVRQFATNIATGAPSSGEYGKLEPEQLYEEFCMSELVFNPPVPVPKAVKPKTRPSDGRFSDDKFEEECKHVVKSYRDDNFKFWIDSSNSNFHHTTD